MAWSFPRLWGGETKALSARGGSTIFLGGGQYARPESPREYLTEGYQFNVVVYRAVREIVQAGAAIGIELYSNDDLVEEHPVLDLLARPNPTQSWDQFIGELLVNRSVLGECAAVSAGGRQPVELWAMSPLDLTIEKGPMRLPSAYVYLKGQRGEKTYPVDKNGNSDLFFYKLFNPLDPWRGQSPMMAAALSADTHNEGSKWNYSLLRNGARPSGLIRFKNGLPSDAELTRLRQWFKSAIQGSANAGDIPMLPDDAEWVQISQSPRDMDFESTMRETAKLVASALGVPIPLVDNDAATFNNIEQAKERFYTDTVIPAMEDLIGALGNWLLPRYGEGLEFRLDLDSLPALEGLREKKYKRTVEAWNASLLTRQEAREALGYEPNAEGEYKPVPQIQQQPNQESKSALLARLAYGQD